MWTTGHRGSMPASIIFSTVQYSYYLLKSNPGNPVSAIGYPVPKPVPTSNH